jgi:hypothetical protein
MILCKLFSVSFASVVWAVGADLGTTDLFTIADVFSRPAGVLVGVTTRFSPACYHVWTCLVRFWTDLFVTRITRSGERI